MLVKTKNIFALLIFVVITTQSSFAQGPRFKTVNIDGYTWKGQMKGQRPKGIWSISDSDNIVVQKVRYLGRGFAIWTHLDIKGNIISNKDCSLDPQNPFHLLPDGNFTSFYDNGKIRSVMLYKNKKANGKTFGLSRYGDTLYVDYLKDGKLEGESKSYYDSHNRLKTVGFYKDDKQCGIWTDFYPNGKMKSQGEFYPQSQTLEYSSSNFKLVKDSLKRSLLDTSAIGFPNTRFFKDKKWSYWDENGNLYLQEWWNRGKYIKGNITK